MGGFVLGGAIHSPAARPIDPLLVVFLRGGADGLSLLAPHGDPVYRRLRPGTAVRHPLDLDGYFGLHPGLAPLLRWWRNGRLLLAPAAGLPVPGDHATAQRRVEGWLAGRNVVRCASLADAARRLSEVTERTDGPPVRLSVDLGGWDTHVDQGSEDGDFAARVHALGDGLATISGATVVVLSEFGRAVRENRCGGTHHGRAGVLFAFGEAVGGGVVGSWPGLGGDVVPVRAAVEALLDQLAGAGRPSSAPSRMVSQSVRTRSHS